MNPPLRRRQSRWRGFEPHSRYFDNWLCRNIRAHSQRLVLLANTTTVAKQNKLLCPSVAEPHLKQALLLIAPTRCEREEKIDDHNGHHAVAPWRWEGEEVGEGGVWSSCYVFLLSAPPKLLIRKIAIYRLLKRDRTLKDQQLGRVRGKWTRVLRLCKHQNQLKAKRCMCAEVREKFHIPDKTKQLSLEPLYVGTKSSLPRATEMPRPRIELGTFRSSV